MEMFLCFLIVGLVFNSIGGHCSIFSELLLCSLPRLLQALVGNGDKNHLLQSLARAILIAKRSACCL